MDRVSVAFREAKDALAVELGPEGRKNAVYQGNKLASVSVTKSGRITVNEPVLLNWVREAHPTEVETVERIRPAFLSLIKADSEAAGEPCFRGELDIPGVNVGEPYPMVRKADGADELVEKLWASGAFSLDGEMKELE